MILLKKISSSHKYRHRYQKLQRK